MFERKPLTDGFLRNVHLTSLVLINPAIDLTCLLSPETKNTWSRDDPSFIVLLTFFLTLTSLAWGLAYTPKFPSIIRLMFSLVFLHFLLTSVVFALAGYIMCGKFLKVPGTGGLGRAGVVAGEGEMEFMYCLEIGVRAFFPVWVFL